MSELKQYQYKSRVKRILTIFFGLFLHGAIGYIFLNTLVEIKTVFFYKPVFNFLVVLSLAVHCLGILVGIILFRKLSFSRWILFALSIVFTSLYGVFIAGTHVYADFSTLLLDAYIENKLYIFLFLAVFPFLAGIFNNAYVKILSGSYFDEKKSAHIYVLMIVLGLFAGGLLYSAEIFSFYHWVCALLPAIVLPFLAFFINLEYNPKPFYAREVKDHSHDGEEETTPGEDITFNYMNFIYIVLYIYLGLLTLVKYYGDVLYIKVTFIGVIALAMAVGFLLSSILQKSAWHIYSEMIYPFFFMFFFIILYRFSGVLPFYYGILFFTPLGLIFGLTLNHSIASIIYRYDQKASHRIITYTVFLIPVPIILALSFVLFTNKWFFILFYVLSALNIVLPGLHLSQKKHSEYRKGMYLMLFVIVVPVFILMHIYFSITFDSKLFVTYTRNYDVIYDINANADYFDVSSNIYFNKEKVMKISDQYIRNLRRSVLSLVLFTDHKEDSVLFIDGNRKFYENSVYTVYDSAECVDYLEKKQIDYNNMPVAGRRSIITFKSDIFTHLRDRDRTFELITDVPNIYDQNFNPFRFSGEYYSRMKEFLSGKSIFVQIIQPRNANICLANNVIHGFRNTFAHAIVFYFGESMVFLGSDSYNFALSSERLEAFNSILESNTSYRSLFYNDIHALSYFMRPSLDGRIPDYVASNYLTMPFITACSSFYFSANNYTDFLDTHDLALQLDLSSLSEEDVSALTRRLDEEHNVLSYLKKSEKASLENNYRDEAYYLNKLQEEGDYNFDIRHYIQGLVSVKELTYIKAAAEFEEGRDWLKARDIYESILILNEDNFEANYRLGLINITLQKISEAFAYFDKAMQLSPANPKVLYQMGVLMYTQGEFRYALEYLHRANNFEYETSMLYLYLGMSYEQIGKYKDAEEYYGRALLLDPNNQDIKLSINRVKENMQISPEEDTRLRRENQNEVEEGEYIPLPINQTAIDKRLTDEELQRYSPLGNSSGGDKYGGKYDKEPGTEEEAPEEENQTIFDLFN